MNFKYMVICGEDVTAAVFTDKTGTEMVRFQVEGTYNKETIDFFLGV